MAWIRTQARWKACSAKWLEGVAYCCLVMPEGVAYCCLVMPEGVAYIVERAGEREEEGGGGAWVPVAYNIDSMNRKPAVRQGHICVKSQDHS